MVKFDEKLCKGCGLCESVCPKKIIHSSGKLNSKGYDYVCVSDMNACISCAFCAIICPDSIITVTKEV